MYKLYLACIVLLLSASCKRDRPPLNPKDDSALLTSFNYALVCNEGIYIAGNATLSKINSNGEVALDVFKQVNNRPLGDVAQSVALIDDKYYIVVNNSGKIEVVNATDFKSIATITGLTSPRFVLNVGNNKAYVSNIVAVDDTKLPPKNYIQIINTQTNTVIDSIRLNGWAEKMVKIGTRAYVASAATKYVYIINTITNGIVGTVELSDNVTDLLVDNSNNIWALSGDYNSHPNQVSHINTTTNTVDNTIVFNYQSDNLHITYDPSNDALYLLNKNIYKLNNSTKSLDVVVQAGKRNFYNCAFDITNKQLCATDVLDFSQRGYLFKFNASNYSTIDSTLLGINPGFVFFK
jgi:DNA-binding beta-propeller fold protein YncE